MFMSAMPRLTASDPELTRALDLVKRALDPLLSQPFLSGAIFADLSLTATVPFTIVHGLGRTPRGFELVWFTGTAACVLRYGTNPASLKTTQITLIPSATGTASVRVF